MGEVIQAVDFAALCAVLDKVKNNPSDPGAAASIEHVQRALTALLNAEEAPSDRTESRRALYERLSSALSEHGVGPGGRIAEVGGPKNSLYREMPEYQFTFLSLFSVPEEPIVIADICHCPHIPDNSFDAVISISVLEHVRQPWSAGREITRILRPGGITMHHAPFSFFPHGAPEDYWRFTTDGMKALFPALETLACEYQSGGRRRNNVGAEGFMVDEHGGSQFAIDAFGGWRENWSVLFLGRKPREGEVRRRVDLQMLVDLMWAVTRHGLAETQAAERTAQLLRIFHFDAEGRLAKRAQPLRHPLSPARVQYLWRRRGSLGVSPGPYRLILPTMFPLTELLEEAEKLAQTSAGASTSGE